MVKNVFEDLTTTISDKERKELLNKIKLSMNLNTSIDDSIYHVDMSKEDKDKVLREEIKGLGFFERLILKIKKFLTGKPEEVLYNSKKFSDLRKYISRKASGITNFETRTISKKFAEMVYSLYLQVSVLSDMFDDFWKKGDTFSKALTDLIETRTDNVVKDIDDLLSAEEIEKILIDRESKNAVKEEVLKSINKHMKSISDEVFYEIEEEILPLYYFRSIICFPYMQFLKGFGFNPYSENSSYSFKNAPVMGNLDYLEKLYYSIYMTMKTPTPVKINKQLGKFFYNEKSGNPVIKETVEGSDAATEEKSDSETDDDEKLKWFYEKLVDIYDECAKINKKVPLVEIIRYYRNDIYFKLAFYVPKLKLKDFYYSNLKIKLLEQVNDKYIKARNSLIEKNIEKFFKGREMKKFMHYRVYTSFEYQKMGVNYFSYLKSLEILFNYLAHYYNPQIRSVLDITTRAVLSQDKITVNTIMMHISNIDDAYLKIQDFDNSLSPDTDDGKMFLRLRYGLGSDNAFLKMYKTFVSEKNKKSKDIIERSLESFDYIIKVYSELLKSTLYELRNSLNSHYTINSKTRTFREHITEAIENMKYFKSLIVQLIKLDEGG